MTRCLPRRAVLGILGIAFLVRMAAACYLGDAVTGLSGAQDEVSYSMLGERFATGHGLTFPTAWYPWIAPNAPQSYYSAAMSLYLATIYTVFGFHPLVARVITGVLSTLVVLMIILITNRIFGREAAILAGLIASVYAYLIFYGVTLVTETPFMLAVLGAIYLAYLIVDSPSLARWILLGLALALATLFRSAVIFFLPALLWWVIHRQRGQRLMVVIPIAFIALFLLPFTIRNYMLWHHFLLLESQFGHVFWNGNYPGQYLSFDPSRAFPIPSDVLASHNDAEITDTLLWMGIHNVLSHPDNFALVTVARLRELFTFWPTSDSTTVANVMRVSSFGILLPFVIAGLALTRRRWRELFPILSFVVIQTAVYSVTWTMIRYRIP
ncbi:MAG: ArnT family glycosyltransferase, partial [Chloroflexota bacterium]